MKKTVGALSAELLKGSKDNNHSAHEQMEENLKDFEKNFYACLDTNKLVFSGPFYIVVLTKKERLLENVLRSYFFARATCPSPDWDQTVYLFNRKEESITHLWTIPDKYTCEYMTQFPQDIPFEEAQLLTFVHQLNDGTLLRWAKILNNEQENSPLLN